MTTDFPTKSSEMDRIIYILRNTWRHKTVRDMLDIASAAYRAASENMTLDQLRDWREHLERSYPEEAA